MTEQAVPTGLPVSTCRSCGSAIVWAFTPKGKRMPVDAVPHEKGTMVLTNYGGHVVADYMRESYQRRHRPHFATCPDAQSWRKR